MDRRAIARRHERLVAARLSAAPRSASRNSVWFGKSLRVETLAPAVIHWSVDGWKTPQDAKSRDVGLGLHVADLDTQSLPDGQEIKFTFYWPGAGHWEGTDFIVRVGSL